MITNTRQYRVTKAQAERFRKALEAIDEQRGSVGPIMHQAMHDQYLSQLQELEEELREYEKLHASGTLSVQVGSLDRLPEALILARVASGMTQKELGEVLGVSAQQVQRDEQTGYVRATFERLLRVAHALGVRLAEPATIVVVDEAHRFGASSTDSVRKEAAQLQVGAGQDPG